MSTPTSTSPTPGEPDAVLARLHDSFTRQKRLVAAQKRKQADAELQATATYYSDLPVTLELLSDKTAGLFTELEHLIEVQQKNPATACKEMLLLQRIRAAVNGELRQSMAFIEDGYRSGFEKLMQQGRFDGRRDSLLPPSTPSPAKAMSSRTVTKSPSLETPPNKEMITVRKALSAHVSLVAESLAVLLQCEVVRIYLYDDQENLRCAAQFPYRACHADPMHSGALAFMTVREVHRTVCHDRLAVNGTLNAVTNASLGTSPLNEKEGVSDQPSGVEDIRSCLIFPLYSATATGRSYGMIHAVNKRYPMVVNANEKGSIEVPLRGFCQEDEVLVSNAARLLATTLSRYPAEAFTSAGTGETIRSRAYPGDTDVFSLSAHILPILQDDIEEAAEACQEALNRAQPSLVYRAPVNSIFASRSTLEQRRRSLSSIGVDYDSSVSTVAFRLRCMNELWARSWADNTTLHQQYRTLENEAQKMRLLLRNVLDGVATARSMRVPPDVAQYLQTLEVYGRSERTERMAAYVAEKMLTLSQENDNAAASVSTSNEVDASVDHFREGALSKAELRKLQQDHARLNTVTVASLHYGGPDGVPSYTSDTEQKREQVRFIDELRRGGAHTAQPSGPAGLRRTGKGGGGSDVAQLQSSPTTLQRLATSNSSLKKYPFQRPFKL